MQRVFITIQFRKLILFFLIAITFIIALSILVVELGRKGSLQDNKSSIINKFKMDKDDASLKKSSGETKVKVYIAEEDKIEEMSLEEYVRGVVAAEMPAAFGIEALKAQAVAARTYVLSHTEEYEGSKCSIGKGADICDTVHCQAYMSKEKRYSEWSKKDADTYWNKITEAVKETEGRGLTYDGSLVMQPYYFSMSSGKTENSIDVFAFDRPYLKSVESEGEKSIKDFETTSTYTYDKLARIINEKYSKANVSAKKLKSQISIVDKTSGAGSVKRMKVGSIVITGRQFRELLGLKPSNFRIVYNTKNVQIICKGYGHGVGMSQWGASIMANEGKNYENILTHYYQGVRVDKLENIK